MNSTSRGPRQFISLNKLKADFQLSQHQIDQLEAYARPYPVLWRCGQLDVTTAMAVVRRLKGWA